MRVLLVLLLLLPLGVAQPGPSVELPVLYLHGDGSSETSGWMNIDPNDAAATDPYWGQTEECPTVTIPPVSAPEPKGRIITVTSQPLPSELLLEGRMEFRLYVGAPSQGNTVDIAAWLDQGGQRIGTAVERPVSFGPASDHPEGKFALVTWSVPVERDHLVAGQALSLTLRMTTDEGNCGDAYIGIGAQRGRSQLALPIVLPPEPEPTVPVFYHDLDGGYVSIDIPFDAPTSEQHRYNWTNPHPEVNITWAVHGAGTVRVAAILNGTPLPPQIISGDNSLVVDRVAGAWSIRLDVEDFEGRLQLLVRAPKAVIPAEDVPEGFDVPEPEGGDRASTQTGAAPAEVRRPPAAAPERETVHTGTVVGAILVAALLGALVALFVARRG